jgi:hypothetical protein
MRAFPAAAALLVAAFAIAPAPLYAVTVEQIVALSKAGVSEAVILALLDRDRTVLTIDPEQLVSLKRDGLSDTLLTAMLRNGRDGAEDAARAVSDANAASVLAALDSSPGVVIIGHGPDRPNTVHTEDIYRGFRDGVRLPSAANVGPLYPLIPRSPYRRSYVDRAFQLPSHTFGRGRTGERALCLAQVNTATGPGPSYVTECPPVMQRTARKR